MDGNDIAYLEMGRKWKSACKVVLGDEIGELSDYEPWLSSIRTLRSQSKSTLSGKEVLFAHSEYSKDASIAAFDEIDFNKEYPQLDINALKDIDSIMDAVSDRVAYAGNVVLGNSKYVEKSTGVLDCSYIYGTDRIAHSKYVAHCTIMTYCENMFGVEGTGASSFVIKGGSNMYISRCLEASKCDNSSDLYYSHGLSNCKDCMFSFNMKSKRNCIGNLELPREKYLQIKGKLLSEMREMLEKDRGLPHIITLIGSAKPDYSDMKNAIGRMAVPKAERADAAPIESAFTNTIKVVLGVPRIGTDKYGKWLMRHVNPAKKGKSCASGAEVLVPEHSHFMLFPIDRLVTLREADFLGDNLRISPAEAEAITMKNTARIISRIAYFCPDWELGNLGNMKDCIVSINSSNCYKCILPLNSKFCSHYYWARDTEYAFGGNETRISSFCVNTYHSEKLQRCFECDCCRGCSDCLFCHNCENVHESMFCFNVKNLRYAIGNFEFPKEKYLEIKRMVLAELNEELGKRDSVGFSIFDIGKRK